MTERYGLTEEELFLPAPEQLMLISQKRGFRDDYNRASEMIILEIRSGKLGTYTLDRWEELGRRITWQKSRFRQSKKRC